MTASHVGPDVLHQVTLADVLRDHTRNRPGALGAVCGEYRLGFPALDGRVNQLAHALTGAGVGDGDRLLWLGQNCHRLLEGLLAASKIGAVFCPANWRQSADEFAFVLNDSDPSVVFWQEAEMGDTLRQARTDTGSKALWLQHDGEGDESYEAFIAGAAATDPGVAVATVTGTPIGAAWSAAAAAAVAASWRRTSHQIASGKLAITSNSTTLRAVCRRGFAAGFAGGGSTGMPMATGVYDPSGGESD